MEHEFPITFDPKVKFTYKEDGVLLTAVLCGHGNLMCVANVSAKHRIAEDFVFLRARLQKAPKFVFTADACVLEIFCMQHEPVYFADTQFFHIPSEASSQKRCSLDPACVRRRFDVVSMPESTFPQEVKYSPKKALQIGWTGTATTDNTLGVILEGMKKELKGKKIPLVVWMQVIHRDLSRSNHLHYQLTNQYLTKQKDAALQATAKAAEGDKKTKKEGDQKKPEEEDCTFEHTLRFVL